MKRNLSIVIFGLFVIWLISVAVLLCYLAQIVGTAALVGAIVAQIGVAVTGAGILITTNTRPWASNDPFAATSDELLRPPLLRDQDRRVSSGTIDNRSIHVRVSDMIEEEAAKRPLSDKTPAWFSDARHDAAEDAFKDTPKDD